MVDLGLVGGVFDYKCCAVVCGGRKEEIEGDADLYQNQLHSRQPLSG